MGDAVNLAARLTARAKPGGILATGDVLDRARTIYATETEPLLVKGKEQAVMAHAITRGHRPAAEQPPDLTPIVGREAELARLQEAVDLARMRQLQVVELVGEPGIGKSRLVQELRTLALGFQQLDGRGRAVLARPSRSAPCGRRSASSSGSRPTARAAEAGAMLQPFVTGMMPDLAPWLPLLAIPFDAEVDADTGDVGARSRREPRQAPLGRRDVPRADPDDADAARDRGRSLARRRIAVPARATSSGSRQCARGSCA